MMKMKTKTKIIAVLGLAVLAGITSCKKDEDLVETPQPTINEPEVITTMTLTFTDAGGVQPTVTATFRDPDGDGGLGADIFDTIRLQNNTTYNCAITLLNETVSPIEDVTLEISDEDDEHLFCFTPSGANVTVTRTDTDGVLEVGLLSQWVTTTASNGTTSVILKHQPGVKDGTCAPGETDIEVNFVTEVL
jgi:hypothetical protein